MGYMCLFQFWFPQGICLGVGLLGHMVVLFLVFFKESPYHLPWWLYQFTFPPTVQECSLFSTPSPAFIVCRLFDDGHSGWCEVISHCSFDWHFFNTTQVFLPGEFYGQRSLAGYSPQGCKAWDMTEQLSVTRSPGDSGGQRSLHYFASWDCSSWDCRKSDTTEWLNNKYFSRLVLGPEKAVSSMSFPLVPGCKLKLLNPNSKSWLSLGLVSPHTGCVAFGELNWPLCASVSSFV